MTVEGIIVGLSAVTWAAGSLAHTSWTEMRLRVAPWRQRLSLVQEWIGEGNLTAIMVTASLLWPLTWPWMAIAARRMRARSEGKA